MHILTIIPTFPQIGRVDLYIALVCSYKSSVRRNFLTTDHRGNRQSNHSHAICRSQMGPPSPHERLNHHSRYRRCTRYANRSQSLYVFVLYTNIPLKPISILSNLQVQDPVYSSTKDHKLSTQGTVPTNQHSLDPPRHSDTFIVGTFAPLLSMHCILRLKGSTSIIYIWTQHI